MSNPFLYTTALPAAVGGAALIAGALRREAMFRKKKAAALAEQAVIARALTQSKPENTLWVQQGVLPIPKGFALTGTTMYVGNGSVGCMRVVDTLIALARIGAEASVGSVLLHECDTRVRQRIAARIPAVYADRVVFAYADDFPEGFGNIAPEEVEKIFGRWSVALKDAIERVAKLHEERNGAKPGHVNDMTSLGGHAFPGVTLIQDLHKRFPDARITGILNLPRKEEQRDYLLALKQRYEDAGVAGWMISDRMMQDNVTQDTVISDLMAGFEAASIASDGAVRLNNVITGITGYKGGGVARYEYIYGEVVAHLFQPDPEQPARYYVHRQQVISELRNLIEKIECGTGTVSLDMPVATDKRQTYDLVLAAVSPTDMLDIRDYVERAREEDDTQLASKDRPHLHPRANYETVYAPWSPSINPKEPRCQVCVIRLRPIDHADDMVSEMVKVPRNRRPLDTTKEYEPALPVSANGETEEW